MEIWTGDKASQNISEKTRTALERLVNCSSSTENCSDIQDYYPKNKTAAVLVLLFEREGALRVLLTTRSKNLRSHPGQTALPGGRVEPQDSSAIATALREAHEECNLDISSQSLKYITTLSPFLSQWKLLVIPVVAFLEDPTSLETLSPCAQEVDRIFTHPLEAILNPSLVEDEVLSRRGSEDWPYEEELYNTSDNIWTQMRGTMYRMHRFRSSASPIKGLTADILMLAAEIAFNYTASYERYAPGQVAPQQMILWAIEDLKEVTTAPPLLSGPDSRLEASAK